MSSSSSMDVDKNKFIKEWLEANDSEPSPLHLAAMKGDAEKVKELVESGADVNQRTLLGWTALHFATAFGGNAATVKLLLDLGNSKKLFSFISFNGVFKEKIQALFLMSTSTIFF